MTQRNVTKYTATKKKHQENYDMLNVTTLIIHYKISAINGVRVNYCDLYDDMLCVFEQCLIKRTVST